jgi:hypothetical protein
MDAGLTLKGVLVPCPHCGRETESGERFCDACGAFLGWNEEQPSNTQQFTQPASRDNEQSAGVQIRLENDLIEVAPGGAESTGFTIKNLGTQVEEFQFLLTGPQWLAVEPSTVSVYPGQEARGAIQAAPPRTPSSTAGVTPFRLTVTSGLHAHVSGSAAGRVEVAPYNELAAEMVPTTSSGRGLTRHHITLSNRGNTALRILLTESDVAEGLRLSVPAVTEVGPGEVTEVPVGVQGRRWLGRAEPKTFSVTADPNPLPPVRLSGSRILVPVFPRWLPMALAGILAASVGAAAIAKAATGHHSGKPTSHISVTTGSSSGSPSASSSGSPSASSSASPSISTTTPPPQGGSSWTTPTTIDPGNNLISVSCASTSFCAAVDTNGAGFTLNGTSWNRTNGVGASGNVTSVSCAPDSNFCAAVDSAGDAVTFNGISWNSPSMIDSSGNLVSVSCASTSFCLAVDVNGAGFTFDGTSWTPTSTAGAYPNVTSVSCAPNSNFCAAVDNDGRAATFDGSGWTPDGMIDPSGNLISVSCASTSFCLAVDGSGAGFTFDGTSWTQTDAADTSGNVTSVSCASTNFCAAVEGGGHAVKFDGNNWTPAGTADSSGHHVNSVSCAASTFCVAVDMAGNEVTGPGA